MSSVCTQAPLISTDDLPFFYANLQSSLDVSTKIKILKITATSLKSVDGDKRYLEKRKYRYSPLDRDIPEDNAELYQIFQQESLQIEKSDRTDPKIQLLLLLLKKPYASPEIQSFLNRIRQNYLEEQQNPFSFLKDRITDGLFSVYEDLPTEGLEKVSIRVHFCKRDNPEKILTISYGGKPSMENF